MIKKNQLVTQTLPSLCGEWVVKEVIIPGSTISNVVVDTARLTYCFDFPISNFDTLDCMEIYNQFIFSNETFALPIQLSNTIEICESLFESYTYDINIGDCEVAAADGGSINISDDHYYVEVDISDTDGESWNIIRKLDHPYPNESGEHEIADGTGDSNMELGPFMIQDGDWELVIQFGDCTYTEYIEAPDYCSGCDKFYEMEITNIQCESSDDTWSFEIYVPWDNVLPKPTYTFMGGTYDFGDHITISGLNIDGGCIEKFIITKVGEENCLSKIVICPPKSCGVDNLNCHLEIYQNEKRCYIDKGRTFTFYNIDIETTDNYPFSYTCYKLSNIPIFGLPITTSGSLDSSGDEVGPIGANGSYLTVCKSSVPCVTPGWEDTKCCKTIYLPALVCEEKIKQRYDKIAQENKVYIAPNPVSNNQVIIFSEIEKSPFEIYDISGRLVNSGFIDRGRNIISVNISTGIYFMRVDTEDGLSKYVKFFK